MIRWLVDVGGQVTAFGSAADLGSAPGGDLSAPAVGIRSTDDGSGYWVAAADGDVFAFGDAGFVGSTPGLQLNRPLAALIAQ